MTSTICSKLIWVLALAGLFLLSRADSAWAVHTIFMQQNLNDRARGTTYPFNAVNIPWSYNSTDTVWTDDGTFAPEVQQAIQSWQSAVPQLSFFRGTPYNLYFRTGPCGGEFDACITAFRTQIDHARQAEYWLSSEIQLARPQDWTSTVRADALRHEIGHWVGLDEQYNEGLPRGQQCSNVISVMNTRFLPDGESCVGVHAPTSWDIDKATRFWKGDNLESPSLSLAFSTLILDWTDAMWTEVWHSYGLWYWSWSLNQWVQVDSTTSYSSGIGFHKESLPRTTRQFWDMIARGWPRGTYYIAGVNGWSWAFETWSPVVWSPMLYVP